MQQIHHKRNELQKVEFFEDAKHTVPFDFTGKKNLYILPKDGDITPLCKLHHLMSDSVDVKIYVAGISYQNLIIFANFVAGVNELNNQEYGADESEVQYYFLGIAEYAEFEKTYKFDNFHNITPNLSKYIPQDNAVLFLTQEDTLKYSEIFKDHTCAMLNKVTLDVIKEKNIKKLTIFLPHGTESEIKKANEIVKELMEKYGVEEVNLFVLYFFKPHPDFYEFTTEHGRLQYCWYFRGHLTNYEDVEFNKIITTNSTGILPVQDAERLQVIDCFDIFQDHLKNQ